MQRVICLRFPEAPPELVDLLPHIWMVTALENLLDRVIVSGSVEEV